MLQANSLSTALKEWATVCYALERGRQIILFRKGGIHESSGEFELDHRQFLLFPTYLHQKREMIKATDRAELLERNTEPEQIRISAAAEVMDIRQLTDRPKLDRLDDAHIWTSALLDIRWNYRSENPLYLLLLRVYRLREPQVITNTPAYAGCKSWVQLQDSISVTGAAPALSDGEYDQHRRAIFNACGIS